MNKNNGGYIVFQIGGNDIGALSEEDWEVKLLRVIAFTRCNFPKYEIVWSDMLPRKRWRHCSLDAAKRHFARLQRRARLHFYQGGYVINTP